MDNPEQQPSKGSYTPPNTLSKCERLARRGDIGRLFEQGEAFLVYPVKCTFLIRSSSCSACSAPNEELWDGHRIMVMAPKRNHKRAVARNLLKRRLREAYRLHKQILAPLLPGNRLDIAFSYIAKDQPLDYKTIETAVIRILAKLCTVIHQKSSDSDKPVSE